MSSYPLYISDDLKEYLRKIAVREHRISLNAQILYDNQWINDHTGPVDPETLSAITDSNPAATEQSTK